MGVTQIQATEHGGQETLVEHSEPKIKRTLPPRHSLLIVLASNCAQNYYDAQHPYELIGFGDDDVKIPLNLQRL